MSGRPAIHAEHVNEGKMPRLSQSFNAAKLPFMCAACIVFCIFCASCSPPALSIQQLDCDPSIGEARLISAVTARGDLDYLPLGLEFRLAPAENLLAHAGEAGLPPTIDLLADDPLESHIKWLESG